VPLVYVNGRLCEPDEAVVSAFDHGLLTGDGVFESIVVRHGRPFGLSRHLARLGASASALGLALPPEGELTAAVAAVVASSGSASGKIRITVTGGRGGLGSARAPASPTVVVACEDSGPPPDEATVVLAPWPRNERGALAGAKTISYAENVVALAWALERGATEALFANLAGNLCEGTGSNVFVGLGGELVTPPLSAGCLAGVTRGLILEVTEVAERDVPVTELGVVEEAFLSSTTRGVQPVAAIDGRRLEHCPGSLTRAAAAAFAELAERGLD
jgi:branched-chain amino acid aminotransferase